MWKRKERQAYMNTLPSFRVVKKNRKVQEPGRLDRFVEKYHALIIGIVIALAIAVFADLMYTVMTLSNFR